jgi:uncharacterized SAM-binding protein YcdF (DUF218 family)
MTSRPRLRAVVLLLFAAVVATAGAVAALIPRDDTVVSPDAVVVLGGAGRERAELGIKLHELHDVPLVLSSSASFFAEELGQACPPATCVVTDPETTIGEAREISRMADERGWERIVVVTTRFHTARARILFRQCLGERVSVVGAEEPGGARVDRGRWVRELGGIVVGSTLDRAC